MDLPLLMSWKGHVRNISFFNFASCEELTQKSQKFPYKPFPFNQKYTIPEVEYHYITLVHKFISAVVMRTFACVYMRMQPGSWDKGKRFIHLAGYF